MKRQGAATGARCRGSSSRHVHPSCETSHTHRRAGCRVGGDPQGEGRAVEDALQGLVQVHMQGAGPQQKLGADHNLGQATEFNRGRQQQAVWARSGSEHLNTHRRTQPPHTTTATAVQYRRNSKPHTTATTVRQHRHSPHVRFIAYNKNPDNNTQRHRSDTGDHTTHHTNTPPHTRHTPCARTL